ncbi:MAG: hypothetical protein Q8P48_09925 [Deltaproteobacteria bacterium]|nr:hypothetical protein [Deltaproteobacteria bacterium]
METKDRVIVIDLTGDGEEAKDKAEKGSGHECRCAECNCGGRDARASEGRLELMTVTEPATRRYPSVKLSAASMMVKKARH